MSDRLARAFLEDICANPDDDTPRLVFADWLSEHGQEERAEFIRVQVERARLPVWDARQVRLNVREAELLKLHEDAWRAELPELEGVRWGAFRRGFVAEAAFSSFSALRASAAACWAAAPVRSAYVRWPRRRERAEGAGMGAALRELTVSGRLVDEREAGYLAGAPLLSTLEALNVPEAALNQVGLEFLLASPHLGGLRALRLPGNDLGNRAAQAIRENTTLTSLEELDLSFARTYNHYGDLEGLTAAGLNALAGWPGLARLRSLNLSGNHAAEGGLQALFRSPYIAGLKELVLRSAGIEGADFDAFSAATPGLLLDVLDVGENLLGDRGAVPLARADCLRDLKVLKMDRCEAYPCAAAALAGAAFLPGLHWLDASHNDFYPEGLAALLAAKLPQLHTLSLARNGLRDDGALAVAASPASDSLLELDLGGNQMTGLGAALGEAERLGSLVVLRARFNQFGRQEIDALRQSPLGRRLAVLDLGEPYSPPHPPETFPEDDIPF